ncbi:exosome complex protein Rrp42 [archaeon]|nr:exosome complex protein Rrp42 [archaeon]
MMNKDYIISLIEQDKRLSNRKLDEYRKVELSYDVSKNADGAARCKIGDTEVIVGVKFNVGEPYPDNPDEGTIIVTAELLPLSSPEFDLGPPGAQATELARVVDRGIRESKALDFKKLCIKKGEKVWMAFIDIYTINDDGNLIDACALAAIAALKNAKLPKYEKERVLHGEYSNKKIELTKLPITCTLGKINSKIIVDPGMQEESVLDSRLTVTTADGNIHAMQKGGEKGLKMEEITQMVDIAIAKEKDLKKLIK